MNEAQKRRKYRALKVAITEFFMVLTVIALVFTLTFVVMGYKITDEGELEQDGFLQIRTSPVGATVIIDGDQLFARTNTSKAISAGEHEVTFSKDGYDVWTKNILITSGLTYRLNYPKLFLQKRAQEKIAKFEKLDCLSVSPDRNYMVLGTNKTKWQLIYLNEEEPTIKEFDLTEIFAGFKEDNFNDVKVIEWDGDGDKILAIAEWSDRREWVLIDMRDLKRSKNLTSEFGMQFSDIKIKTKNGEQLLVLENGNLRKLNISTAEVSRILLSKVEQFKNFGAGIIYIGRDDNNKRHIGFYQDGDNEGVMAMSLDDEAQVNFTMSEYYGDAYVTFAINNNVKIYRGSLGTKQENNVLLVDEDLGFVPNEIYVRGEGELTILKNGKSYAIYDVETNKFTKYELENENIKWMNDYMFSFVSGKKLIVEDFDKGNRRKFADNVVDGFVTPIVGDRWIYYVDSNNYLMREKITD